MSWRCSEHEQACDELLLRTLATLPFVEQASFMLFSPLVSPAPPFSALLFLPAMCAAVIVAIRTLFGLSRSREST